MARSLTLADLKDPREAAFVAAIFELGGPQYGAEAALRAGYTTDQAEAPRIGAILLAAPRIARVITGEVRARFDVAAAAAFDTILTIATDPKAPASARLTAAQEILSRSSIGPVPSRSMSLHANVTVEELLSQLDISGQPAGAAGDVIDVEAVDVTPGPPAGKHAADLYPGQAVPLRQRWAELARQEEDPGS